MNYLLSLLFLCVGSLSAMAQTPLQTKVTITFTDQSLDKALQQLQTASTVNLAFTREDVEGHRVKPVEFRQETLENILKIILQESPLVFKESGGYVILTKATKAASSAITGKITDIDTKEPLAGVSVVVNTNRRGVTTDANGNFTIAADLNDILLISYAGYEAQQVPLASVTSMNIALKRSGALGEVVVLGFGQTQKKIAQTGAVASITTKEIKQSPTANITNALTGRLPGLITVQRSGEPGADGPELYIRGRATLNSNAPLLTIDGVQKESNALAILDPNEVESITILKDASATALYGVKGANGVIIVKTRRGKEGKPRVNASLQTALQTPTRLPKYLDAYHFALLANEAYKNDNPNGTLPPYTADALKAYESNADPYRYPNVDWMKEMLKPAQMTRADFNVSGGSPMVKYFVNVGYVQQNGLYKAEKNDQYDPNLKYKRYNFRSNIDIDLDDNFSLGLSLFGSIENQNAPNVLTNDIFTYLEKTPPNAFPIKYPTGFYGGTTRGNPFALVNTTGYKQGFYSSLSGMFTATRKLNFITEGLFAKMNYSFDGYFRNDLVRSREERTALYNGVGDVNDTSAYTYSGGDAPLRAPSSTYTQNRSTWLDLSLNYDRSFGAHNITGLVLANRQQRVIGGAIPFVSQGLVSRITWNYRNTYFAEFNAGFNGTDNFAKDKRYGFFPAVSAGWVISKERFLKNNDFIDLLKLRGSYGLTGNDQLGDRRWLFISEYASGPGYSFGEPLTAIGGNQEGAMANSAITWEKARKLNLGLEMQMLRNLLSVTVDLFQEKRNDILITRGTVPSLIGVPSANLPPANMGEIVNRGVEVEINHTNHIGRVNYFVRANGSFSRNKILFMDEVSYPYDYLRRTGQQIGQIYGLTAIGFFKSVEEIQNSARQFGNLIPGDIKYKDLNGDGVIDNNDKGPIGRSTVPEFLYGITGSISYKNWDMSILFQGAGNYNVTFSHEAAWEFYNGAKVMEHHLGRWTPATAATATYPVLHYGQNNNNHQENSSFFMKNASYLRLKNLELGYTLKRPRITNGLGFSSVRIYANGINLHTWDKMGNGSYDPEAPSGKGFFYPQLRVVNIGISADF